MEQNNKRKLNPFNNIIENVNNSGEEKETIKKKGLGLIGNIQEKGQSLLESKANKLKEQVGFARQNEYQDLNNEILKSTSANNWYILLSPISGLIGGPLMLILNVGLDQEQLSMIKSVFIGSGIGALVGGILAIISQRDAIKKAFTTTYRHFKTKTEVDDIKREHVTEKNEDLIKENDELKTKKEQLEKDLYEYNIQKEIKKREKEKRG